MKNKGKIALIIGILVAVISIGIFVATATNSSSKIADQLALGNKYLEEMNYDAAIASFLGIIEIEPNNIEAYTGLADAYLAKEDYENAKIVLEELNKILRENNGSSAEEIVVAENNGNATEEMNTVEPNSSDVTNSKMETKKEISAEEVQNKLDAIVKLEQTEAIKKGSNGACDKIVAGYSSGDYDSALAGADQLYQYIINNMDEGTDRLIIPMGDLSIGVYKKNSIWFLESSNGQGKYASVKIDYYIYCGEYLGQSRHGNGMYMIPYPVDSPLKAYTVGEWENNQPNGMQTVHTEGIYFQGNSPKIQDYSGNVTNGIWDGTVNFVELTCDDAEGTKLRYDNLGSITFVNGSVEIIGTDSFSNDPIVSKVYSKDLVYGFENNSVWYKIASSWLQGNDFSMVMFGFGTGRFDALGSFGQGSGELGIVWN